MNKFTLEIKKILKKEKIDEVIIETPPDPAFGDYAVPCFTLAKTLKKSPNLIAEELSKKLMSSLFESIAATGPYINFFAKKEAFAQVLSDVKDDYGKGSKKSDKIMVEYCQVNTHKAFHVGHLRGTILGASLINILRYNGYRVVSANYQGDIGAHVAKVLWYMTRYKAHAPKENLGAWLGEIYQKANKKIGDDEKLKREVSEVLQKVESGDKRLTKLWKETRKWSLDDYERFYKVLGVSFDNYFFESQLEKPGKEIVKELLSKGVAEKSEGAVVINLEKYGLGVFLILKTDGTALYGTKDLALAKQKFEKFKVNRAVYVVGSEQNLYFKQLFKSLELMKFKDAKKCFHLPFGLVMLEGGKISSREGELILAEELVRKVEDYAKGEVRKRHEGWSAKEISESARNITLSAIKFTMINQDSNKPIIFDIKRALDFEGETGPYVQYAHARISSILRKHGKRVGSKIDFSVFDYKEHNIIKMLERFPEALEEAAKNYRPQIIARYVLDLAQIFNEFYHSHQILKEKEDVRNARLFLIDKIRIVLKNSLNLLGIEAPGRM